MTLAALSCFQTHKTTICVCGHLATGPAGPSCGPKGPWHTPSRSMAGSCLYEGSPGKSCPDPVRRWQPVTPAVIGEFSAVCYYTALNVAKMRTKRRPIGLIESDWGGTPVQAWTPPTGLQACGRWSGDGVDHRLRALVYTNACTPTPQCGLACGCLLLVHSPKADPFTDYTLVLEYTLVLRVMEDPRARLVQC
jgi:hypothetical protein